MATFFAGLAIFTALFVAGELFDISADDIDDWI